MPVLSYRPFSLYNVKWNKCKQSFETYQAIMCNSVCEEYKSFVILNHKNLFQNLTQNSVE